MAELSDKVSKYANKLLLQQASGIIRKQSKHELVFMTGFMDLLEDYDLDRPETNRVNITQINNMLYLVNRILNTDYQFV